MTARTAPIFNSHFSKGVLGLVTFLFLLFSGCYPAKDVRYNFGINPGVHMGIDAMHRIHPVPQPHVQLEIIPPNRFRRYPVPGNPPYSSVPPNRTAPPPTFLPQPTNQ